MDEFLSIKEIVTGVIGLLAIYMLFLLFNVIKLRFKKNDSNNNNNNNNNNSNNKTDILVSFSQAALAKSQQNKNSNPFNPNYNPANNATNNAENSDSNAQTNAEDDDKKYAYEPPDPSIAYGDPENKELARKYEEAQFKIDLLTKDVKNLQNDVKILQEALTLLQNDFKQELSRMKIMQNVAPIYGDAMQMASAGYDADNIAERCGIARAEAELVTALAKSKAPANNK